MTKTIREYDNNGNVIHSRDSDGYEVWCEYDNNGKCIHFRDSDGYEVWYDYDTNGNVINTRNTSGATGHHHAAAEEKVRGECAAEQELAKVRGEYWEVVRKNLELLQRAERAEAERDAAIRQRNEKQATIGLLRVANQEWQVKLADAKREGAYEAIVDLANAYPSKRDWLMSVAKTHYAPTPARSVVLGEWRVSFAANALTPWTAAKGQPDAPRGQVTTSYTSLVDLLATIRYTPTPTEYTALCALAEGK
jgi:YD repeat-containing protein